MSETEEEKKQPVPAKGTVGIKFSGNATVQVKPVDYAKIWLVSVFIVWAFT
jgi:hypothetical protein